MRRYIQSLDGIRGFGILFVLLYHLLRLNGSEASVMGFSWIWIQMFFVQSGFLITEILLESKKESFGLYASHFYWKRLIRIFPVYLAYVFAFFIVYLLIHWPSDFLDRLPYLLTFTFNYTRFLSDLNFNNIWFIHFWSLAVEEQFYLVWPMLIYFLDRKNLKRLIVAAVFLIPIFRYWLATKVSAAGYSDEMTGEITYAFTLSQFDAFAVGAAIPLFNLRERIQHPMRWILVVLVIVIVAGALNYISLKDRYPDFSFSSAGISVAMIDNFQHVWSYSLINFLFLFVILLLIRESYKGLFNFRPLVDMGKVVYGLYIFHFAVLFCITFLNTRYIHNFYISFVMACVVSYIVAYISYNYFEKRFLSLRDWPWRNTKK